MRPRLREVRGFHVTQRFWWIVACSSGNGKRRSWCKFRQLELKLEFPDLKFQSLILGYKCVEFCGLRCFRDLDLTSFGIAPGDGSRTRGAVSRGPVAGLVPTNGNTLSVFVAISVSSVTSRKFTMVLFASIVIFRPFSRKILHSSFLIFSISCGILSKAARPSSQYRSLSRRRSCGLWQNATRNWKDQKRTVQNFAQKWPKDNNRSKQNYSKFPRRHAWPAKWQALSIHKGR